MAQFPPPIAAAVRGLCHPNLAERLTVGELLAANGTTSDRHHASKKVAMATHSEKKLKKGAGGWLPPAMLNGSSYKVATGDDENPSSVLLGSAMGGGHDDDDDSSNADEQASLTALFPSYFTPLYDYLEKVVACEQEADMVSLDSVTDAKAYSNNNNINNKNNNNDNNNSVGETGANAGAGAGASGNGKTAARRRSPVAASADAARLSGVGLSKDDRVAKCKLEALVATLEALPSLVELPPIGFAMALPHILNAVRFEKKR
jgi:hypothetical protein